MEEAMETSQFDSTLGGTETLPYSANSLKFAASRSVEIAAMTESIRRPSNVKLIFQSLPVHMRRRVMSHNAKRLPIKLRTGHLEQLRKSGLPPQQKRPSRKYRRRPANLLEEYTRRQKQKVWLETHIWHAKRFHMIERWGYRLPYAPCDKAFRACYRASSAHCLLQDISYYVPIQITGTIENIQKLFSKVTNPSCGLGVCAKAYVNGNREGMIHLYNISSFPYGYIGRINFIWVHSDNPIKTLWLFVHPQQVSQVEKSFKEILGSNERLIEGVNNIKKRKLDNTVSEQIKFQVLPGIFNRYRLIGPNSQAILENCLICVDDSDKIKGDEWVKSIKTKLHLEEKNEYWQKVSGACSPSQLPSKIVIGLIVRDPRLSRPPKRNKAKPDSTEIDTECLINIPTSLSQSPLWDTSLHQVIKSKRLTNGQFIAHVTKTQWVPGEVFFEDPKVQSVPVVLVQKPGSQDPNYKKLGYGSGWDIIVPSGYGLPFWHTFIMFGGRAGGLRETENLAFEMGESYFSPDSESGREEEMRIEAELREKYFRLPPSKRVNYTKLAVNSPFVCHWSMLLSDWCNDTVEKFFVLRDRRLLDNLQTAITRKQSLPQINNSDHCLVPVYIQMQGKGNLKRHALLCMPKSGDFDNIKTLTEPHREDPNEKLRREKRIQHLKDLKKRRRKRIKMKKNAPVVVVKRQTLKKSEPSEYVKAMRELWLPSRIQTVRHSASRETIGYLSQAAFSFTEAHGCGLGYIAYNALATLLKTGHNKVLVRNTTSRKYQIGLVNISVNN